MASRPCRFKRLLAQWGGHMPCCSFAASRRPLLISGERAAALSRAVARNADRRAAALSAQQPRTAARSARWSDVRGKGGRAVCAIARWPASCAILHSRPRSGCGGRWDAAGTKGWMYAVPARRALRPTLRSEGVWWPLRSHTSERRTRPRRWAVFPHRSGYGECALKHGISRIH